MGKSRVAFVTGGTGFLGSCLIRSLAVNGYTKIYALARGDSGSSSQSRLYKILNFNNDKKKLTFKRKVEVLDGDICHPNLGLSRRTIHSLLRNTTDIFHLAALADFNIPLNVIRKPNVQGTEHICELALLGNRNSDIPIQMHYVSTVFVAGTLRGWFKEKQFNCGQHFYNSYEQTKFEAEELVRSYSSNKNLEVTIYRPAIITGDSKNGVTTNFKMVYQPLHFLALGIFPELPVDEDCWHSLVPVDMVAEAICLLSKEPLVKNATWHLINSSEVKIRDLFEVASQVIGCRKPTLIPLERFSKKRLSPVQWNILSPFLPYFNYPLRFSAENTNKKLNSLGFRWPKMDREVIARLFQYCIDSDFIHAKNLSRFA